MIERIRRFMLRWFPSFLYLEEGRVNILLKKKSAAEAWVRNIILTVYISKMDGDFSKRKNVACRPIPGEYAVKITAS